MSEWKFTPGPWRVQKGGNIGNLIEAQSGRKAHKFDDGWRCRKGCAVGLASRRGDRPDSCGAIADRCLAIADAEIAAALKKAGADNARLREALQYFVRGFDAHNAYLARLYGPDTVIPDDVHIAAARALLAELGQ